MPSPLYKVIASFLIKRIKPVQPEELVHSILLQGRSEGLWRLGQETKWRPIFFFQHFFVERLTPWKLVRQKVTSKKRKGFHIFHARTFLTHKTNMSLGLYPYRPIKKMYCFWYAKSLILYFLHLPRFCAPWTWRPGQVPPFAPPSYVTVLLEGLWQHKARFAICWFECLKVFLPSLLCIPYLENQWKHMILLN